MRHAGKTFRAGGDLPRAGWRSGPTAMDQTSDSELLERARQGHSMAVRALVRRHDAYLYRVARSVLRDDHEAEDVVQQTFLQAFTKILDFRGDANLRTWLTR